MTVIAALKANNQVYLGCDSLFISNLDRIPRIMSKLVVKDELVIGLTTGCSRAFQEITFRLKLPSTKNIHSDDLMEYMVLQFCPKVYKLFNTVRILEDDKDRKESAPSISPSQFLVGIRDKLFEVGRDFDVSELNTTVFAIGSGGDYAIGSLNATTTLVDQMNPEDQIVFALKTSAEFNQGVKGPFQVINTKDLILTTYQ